MNDLRANDLKTLSERIDLLETRLTFQDATIETRQIAALSARLQEAEAQAPGPANERPPHY